MTECDLLIAVGARFSDRVTGKVSEFAPHAKIIHIDIDPAEIGKVVDPAGAHRGRRQGGAGPASAIAVAKDGAAPASVKSGRRPSSLGATSLAVLRTQTSPTTRTRSSPEIVLDRTIRQARPARLRSSPPKWDSTRCGRTKISTRARPHLHLLGRPSAPWASASPRPSALQIGCPDDAGGLHRRRRLASR